mmetsp:Transcript_46389/g.110494  ORF Transcript_46389/g.110494 Transcript_46389/m.110494 type:complete len:243 (+) Transcript_46389:102-830(+)
MLAAIGIPALSTQHCCKAAAMRSSVRWMSMPSRVKTWPFILRSETAASSATLSEGSGARWHAKTSAGIAEGPAAARLGSIAKRAQALSPMLPAQTVLHSAIAKLQGGTEAEAVQCAMVCLAEQTLSTACIGNAGAWILRGGKLLASVEVEPSQSRKVQSMATPLRVDDVVLLAVNIKEPEAVREVLQSSSDEEALQATGGTWLRFVCSRAEAAETVRPIGSDAPNQTWVRTVFNEYGDHSST